MQKVRCLIAKDMPVRFISHLDYAKTIERAIRRAKLPVALSQGFNPHYKISYGSALAVGETSGGEVVEIELREKMDVMDLQRLLQEQLPTGLRIVALKEVPANSSSITGLPYLINYKVQVPLAHSVVYPILLEKTRAFAELKEIPWEIERKKGKKRVDLRQFLEKFTVEYASDGLTEFSLVLHGSTQGGVKPREVLEAFAHFSGIKFVLEDIYIHRVQHLLKTSEGLRTPMDI